MTDFAIYDRATGIISRVGFGPDEATAYAQAQGSPIEGVYIGSASANTNYIDVSASPHELLSKTTNTPNITASYSPIGLDADGVDTVTISGLVNPTEVTALHSNVDVPTTVTTVTDGSYVMSTDTTGTITLIIQDAPHLDLELEVSAV